MIKNYLLASWRILIKEKLYTIINAMGLAVALATCFVIYSWVKFETSYDKGFNGHQQVYRVATLTPGSTEPGMASTYPMVKTIILSQFPEIETSARIFNAGLFGTKTKVSFQDKVFTDNRFYYGDSSILKIFPFKMIEGDSSTALSKPNALVITETIARKYFGTTDVIGKPLIVGKNTLYEVTGVIRDLPPNTHFHFDMLASMESHPWIKRAELNVWSGVVFHTYLKLKPGSSADDLENKLSEFMNHFPNDPQGFGKEVILKLQPINDIHLTSSLKFELEPNGDQSNVYLFITIGMLVMLVALINYTNLATARHTQRFREVAVRKVLGATRSQLIFQFLTETIILTSGAFLIAGLLVEITRPLLTSLSGQPYLPSPWLDPIQMTAAFLLLACIGLLTGFLPALVLASVKAIRLFRPSPGPSFRGISVRRILIVTQFTVSIALTICTAITYQQLQFVRHKSLGYELEHTMVLNIGYEEMRTKYATLKSALAQNPDVLGITAVSELPTDIQSGENIDISRDQSLGVYSVSVDPDFFKVMKIPVLEGDARIGSIQPSDSINHFVVTESARKAIGWKSDEALTQRMSIRHGNQKPGQVMGVVNDFHFQSLHHPISPLVLEFNPDDYQYLLVKVKDDNLRASIDFITTTWKNFSDGIPMEFTFLDQDYSKLYAREERSGTLFTLFSVVAMFISLLGLFGLSSFSVERRTREIGLRKILGASGSQILALISSDFIWLLLISFTLALPVGIYFLNTWLSQFVYKVSVGPALFILAGIGNLALALITLSYQSVKISGTNPVETLRQE